MSDFAIAEVTTGKLNALVKNLMKQMGIDDPIEAVRRINSGQWVVSEQVRLWWEQDNIIYLSVTSDGTTGPQWVKELKAQGVCLEDNAEKILCSAEFRPTSGVTSLIAILTYDVINKTSMTIDGVWAEAQRRKLAEPSVETACLIRRVLSDKDILNMSLWWINVIHVPVVVDEASYVLRVDRDGGGRRLCATAVSRAGSTFHCANGFAFVAPESGS